MLTNQLEEAKCMLTFLMSFTKAQSRKCKATSASYCERVYSSFYACQTRESRIKARDQARSAFILPKNRSFGKSGIVQRR